ncbi:MAG TPA: MBL fold metallo-hydrolase [Clostridiaceae bacterium]|nr:MBL fold metallo-hydrolase [Clostridiaceae bacterium]
MFKNLSFLTAPMWSCCSLFSGSSGNSIFVSGGNTKILVDAGRPAKYIEAELANINVEPTDIDAILVTHEHTDHMQGVGPMARRYRIPVYTNEPTWNAMLPRLGNVAKVVNHVFVTGASFAIGDVRIISFATPHDSAESVGFVIETEKGRIAVCTDLGEMTDDILASLSDAQLVFLEANYDEQMLLSGPYPWHLKQRIRGGRGHLSNDCTMEAATRLTEAGVDSIILSHLSKENNFPMLAELTVRQGLEAQGIDVDTDLSLHVAPRYHCGQMLRYQSGRWG